MDYHGKIKSVEQKLMGKETNIPSKTSHVEYLEEGKERYNTNEDWFSHQILYSKHW